MENFIWNIFLLNEFDTTLGILMNILLFSIYIKPGSKRQM